jgi:hypothetical protein
MINVTGIPQKNVRGNADQPELFWSRQGQISANL